jgi:methylated-DNA-protein-cysteine methyltransferase-like protein
MDLPEPVRSTFNQIVWEIVKLIPPGKVASYGQVAAFIPVPQGVEETQYAAYRARWVGNAMSMSPKDVPWQRVINAQGKISLSRGGWQEKQRRLLEAEGVAFNARDRVDMGCFGWSGPPEAWLRDHGLIVPPGVAHSQDSLF